MNDSEQFLNIWSKSLYPSAHRAHPAQTSWELSLSTYQGSIYWKIPPPPEGREKLSGDVILGKKYEKVKRKRGKM
jgi:hypothetical protein